ncbi:MAG TPA: DUF2871 domain-containing protein [Candidatus Mediterraneibacter colneyensis]|nr:DUF2871 domain-containing protein [Candidatus Mediterraneibacter colneyensis]
MKRYINFSLLYAVLAMAGGVFYREFTKFNGFSGKTSLSVVHTHYFLLGITLSSGAGAAISGIAGIGHILLGVSLVLVLVQIRERVS